jgi:hypothetical protein
MKKMAFLMIAALIFAPIPTVFAQQQQCSAGGVSAFNHETITVSTTAKTLTASVYNPTDGPKATVAYVSVNANNLRAWFDGTAPTTSAGFVISAGQTFTVCGQDIPKLQMIRDDASDVEVAVQYFAPPQ